MYLFISIVLLSIVVGLIAIIYYYKKVNVSLLYSMNEISSEIKLLNTSYVNNEKRTIILKELLREKLNDNYDREELKTLLDADLEPLRLVINKKYPNLSRNEKEISSLLKLDLSTKEIARITGKSTQSIEVARVRLRRKLGINNKKLKLSEIL